MTETFTCESCGDTLPKGWSDEEAAAEAEELFPGINVSDESEAGVVCDDCFRHIMGRVRAEAPELIGEGWRGHPPEPIPDYPRFLSEDCGECGTPGYQRHLSAVNGCATCVAEDPRPVYIPVRNVLMGALNAAKVVAEQSRYSPFTGVASASPQPFGECYPMASGAMVHVRPGCRCKT